MNSDVRTLLNAARAIDERPRQFYNSDIAEEHILPYAYLLASENDRHIVKKQATKVVDTMLYGQTYSRCLGEHFKRPEVGERGTIRFVPTVELAKRYPGDATRALRYMSDPFS